MKVTYIESTGEVTGFNRGALEGELELNIDQTKDMVKGYGYDQFDKYRVVNGVLTLKTLEEIEHIGFIKSQSELKVMFKQECTEAILAKYPDPIQRSAALGIYPQELIDEMTGFIAYNIEEENRVFDEAELATTQEELYVIQPVFGEIPNA